MPSELGVKEGGLELGECGEVVGKREGAVTYRFLSLLLEMNEEDRADREQRRSREGKLACP